MSNDLNLLNQSFQDKVRILLSRCYNDGAIMRPFFTVRNVKLQAVFWRQSRCLEEIDNAVKMLRKEGADYLANVLLLVGPSYGKWVTNALPGASTHQYACAIDCYSLEPDVHGTIMVNWDHMNPYKIYAHHAKNLGLNAGYFWKPKEDAVHVQEGSFILPKTWKERNDIMKERFGDV
jgi:hypothetical protein